MFWETVDVEGELQGPKLSYTYILAEPAVPALRGHSDPLRGSRR